MKFPYLHRHPVRQWRVGVLSLLFFAGSAVCATDMLSCLETNYISICRNIRLYNISNQCSYPSPDPDEIFALKNPVDSTEQQPRPIDDDDQIPTGFTFFPKKSRSTPQKDDSDGHGGYGSDEDSDPRRKPGGRPGSPEEQYFIIRILVRLRYWIEAMWDSLSPIDFSAALYSTSDDFFMLHPVKTSYSQQLGKHIDSCLENHQELLPDSGLPQVTTTDLLHVDWDEYDGEAPPSTGITMIPAGSKQAYAIISIPFSIQYSDWNDLDRQQAQWTEESGQLLQRVSASWSAIYPHLYQLLQEQHSLDCQFDSQDEQNTGQLNFKCLPVSSPVEIESIRPGKPKATMITLTVMDPASSETLELSPDEGVVMVPLTKGKREKYVVSGVENKPTTASAKPKKKRLPWSSRRGRIQDGGGDDDPISRATLEGDVAINDTARLIDRLRVEIHSYLMTRFIAIDDSRTSFAETFFDIFTMLKDSATAQEAMLTYFRSAQEVNTLGMKGSAYQIFSRELSSAKEFYKRTIKPHWSKRQVQLLIYSGAMDDFYIRMMRDKRVFLQLLKKLNTRSTRSLSDQNIRDIEIELNIHISTPTYFLHDLNYPTTVSVTRPATQTTGQPVGKTPERKARHSRRRNREVTTESDYPMTGDDTDDGGMTDDEFREKFETLSFGSRRTGSSHSLHDSRHFQSPRPDPYQTLVRSSSQSQSLHLLGRDPSSTSIKTGTSGYLSMGGTTMGGMSQRTYSSGLGSQSGLSGHSFRQHQAQGHPPRLHRSHSTRSTSYLGSGRGPKASLLPPPMHRRAYDKAAAFTPTTTLVQHPARSRSRQFPPPDVQKWVQTKVHIPDWIPGELPPDTLSALDSYLIMITSIHPVQLVQLANIVNAPNKFTLLFADYLRENKNNQPRLLAMMKEYVKRQTFLFSPRDSLKQLISSIQSVVPGTQFDSQGILLLKKESPATLKVHAEETEL